MTGVLIKRENSDIETDKHGGKMPWTPREKAIDKECHTETRKEAWNRLSSKVLGRN